MLLVCAMLVSLLPQTVLAVEKAQADIAKVCEYLDKKV